LYAISVHAIRKNGVVCKLPLPAIIKEDIITYYPAKHIETIFIFKMYLDWIPECKHHCVDRAYMQAYT
jgi:hypothetical protein